MCSSDLQRIAIARALYRKPSVLVFDEATAALDNQTEKEVTSAIESLAGKQTIVIVAHRLTTVQNCDLVVLLSEGRVMDVGRYDELLSRNPFFRQLALAPVDRSEAP